MLMLRAQALRWWMRGLLFLFFYFALPSLRAMDIAMVSPPEQAVYERFAQAMLTSPNMATIRFERREPQNLQSDAFVSHDMVLAVGMQSAQVVLSLTSKPILVVMISEENYQELKGRFPQAPLAGIVLDQPVARQLALFKALWPDKSALGVLLGQPGSALHHALQKDSSVKGLVLKFGFLTGTRGSVPVLEALMEGSDAILAPWDREAFNAQNARVILLTTYRAGVPILAYSAAAVEAGALAAVFSTPENIASQVADWLAQQKAQAIRLPVQRTPRDFEIALNPQVARSLRQDIPDRETVLLRMREVSP